MATAGVAGAVVVEREVVVGAGVDFVAVVVGGRGLVRLDAMARARGTRKSVDGRLPNYWSACANRGQMRIRRCAEMSRLRQR